MVWYGPKEVSPQATKTADGSKKKEEKEGNIKIRGIEGTRDGSQQEAKQETFEKAQCL